MLDHFEYLNLGGSIEDWAQYKLVLQGVICDLDRHTFGRFSQFARALDQNVETGDDEEPKSLPLPKKIQCLIVELCELAAPYGSDTDDKLQRHKDRLIRTYLANVKTSEGIPLLYRGVDA